MKSDSAPIAFASAARRDLNSAAGAGPVCAGAFTVSSAMAATIANEEGLIIRPLRSDSRRATRARAGPLRAGARLRPEIPAHRRRPCETKNRECVRMLLVSYRCGHYHAGLETQRNSRGIG